MTNKREIISTDVYWNINIPSRKLSVWLNSVDYIVEGETKDCEARWNSIVLPFLHVLIQVGSNLSCEVGNHSKICSACR